MCLWAHWTSGGSGNFGLGGGVAPASRVVVLVVLRILLLLCEGVSFNWVLGKPSTIGFIYCWFHSACECSSKCSFTAIIADIGVDSSGAHGK